jgi:tetratricopeptide (TPR) repeat protein
LATGRSPLDPAQWQRAVEIFERLVDLPPAARERVLGAEAEGEVDLLATVRAMFAADEDTNDLIDQGIEPLAHLAGAMDIRDEAPLREGDQVGDFAIISEIGRGGMGVVYAARDRTLGRVAALKLLPIAAGADSSASERLVAEAQSASALDHPNVATIYQIGTTTDGHRFIAMARYEGETLRERLARGAIPPRDAFDIARQVAAGLAAAHQAGLVHRDVKPENIFITRDGLVKLLDFGIATLASSAREGSTTRGTLRYMSPEHARCEAPDSRSDVWSLGVVLYEMIAGSPPFTGATAAEILALLADPQPVRAPDSIRRLPAVATAVIMRAVEKDPTKRYADGSAIFGDLERATRHWARARNLTIAAAAFVAFAAAAFGAWSGRAGAAQLDVTKLAVLPVAGNLADTLSASILGALTDEVAARVTGLGRVSLVPARDTLAPESERRKLHLFRLTTRHRGDATEVTGSLQSALDRRVLWTESRTFHRAAIHDLSRDFVIGILGALGKPLTPQERHSIGRGFPANAGAYEQFLLGNKLLALRTPASVQAALLRYRDAARLDSTFAAAFARQSYAYSVLVDWGWKPSPLYPGDPLAEGLRLANRAVALDSTSADAWLARGYLLVQRDPRRLTGAVEALQHVITLDPYNAEAFYQYGQTLTVLGRYTEALAAYYRALDIEPDRAMAYVPIAAIYRRQGRLQEAHRVLDSALAVSPRVPYAVAARSLVRVYSGDAAGALKDAEFAFTLDSSYRIPPLVALSKALGALGDTAGALTRLEEATRLIADPAAPTYTEAYWIGMAAVALGKNDLALSLLRRVKVRGAWLWFMYEGTELDEFRKISEAAAILEEADPRRPVK